MPADAPTALYETRLALPGMRRGKVRDIYNLPDAAQTPRLLIVATDRVSAFDVVMPTPIPGKGGLLTELALWWFGFIERRRICSTHLLRGDAGEIPASAFGAGSTPREQLSGRVTIARRAKVFPIECVVRGYLEGSGWREYRETGAVCGVRLPAGLRRCDRLPEPIFTPATKEELGKHDENITLERAGQIVGHAVIADLKRMSLEVYRAAAEHARSRGIIIADTKFEFGVPCDSRGNPLPGEGPMLVDEALTPDSSRFWPADAYEPGRPQRSFDKQFLREYLESLVAAGRWNKQAPGPELPGEIVDATLARYREARDRLVVPE